MKLQNILRQVRSVSTITADTQHVIYRRHPPVILIGINNPANRNAITDKIAADLKDALARFENDTEAKIGVVFGEGGNFCAGYDLKELAERLENPPEHFIKNNLVERFTNKPLIAAVNGYAVGAGFDLALMCDLRVMERSAALGYYGRRFGVPVSKFGIQKLTAMVGFSRCMDLVLTGRAVRGEEAFNIGLSNRLVESGTVIGHALSLAQDIAKFPQAAIFEDRRALYRSSFPDTCSKFSNMCDNSEHQDEILQDIKKGAKLFSEGVGKKGLLFSKFLWNKI